MSTTNRRQSDEWCDVTDPTTSEDESSGSVKQNFSIEAKTSQPEWLASSKLSIIPLSNDPAEQIAYLIKENAFICDSLESLVLHQEHLEQTNKNSNERLTALHSLISDQTNVISKQEQVINIIAKQAASLLVNDDLLRKRMQELTDRVNTLEQSDKRFDTRLDKDSSKRSNKINDSNIVEVSDLKEHKQGRCCLPFSFFCCSKTSSTGMIY